MIMISGPAGRRLARAKAAQDEAEADEEVSNERIKAVRIQFGQAAMAVADELIASGHHESEGD